MPQFLGGWYVQAAVPIPVVQPEGVSCAYSIYGEDGSKNSMHDWHIQGGLLENVSNLHLQEDI